MFRATFLERRVAWRRGEMGTGIALKGVTVGDCGVAECGAGAAAGLVVCEGEGGEMVFVLGGGGNFRGGSNDC